MGLDLDRVRAARRCIRLDRDGDSVLVLADGFLGYFLMRVIELLPEKGD